MPVCGPSYKFKLQNQIRGVYNNLYFWLFQIIKHSFAYLEALLFLFVIFTNFDYCLPEHFTKTELFADH